MHLKSEFCGQDLLIAVEASRIDAVQAIDFKDKFRAAVAGSDGRVVLDMSAVGFVDSSGLGAIVASMKALGGSRKLELAGLQANVEKVFRLTRLDSVFTMHATASEARRDLTGAAPSSVAV